MIAINTVSEAIKKEFGSQFSTDAHKDNDLIRYINSWARSIIISRNFPFYKYTYSFTTTDVDTEYSIPYQIETFAVLNSSWDEIELLDFEDYYIEKNKDNKICIFEDKLITTIKWTFTILYRWFIPTITSLTWNIDLPEYFFDLLVVISTYYGFMDIKAYNVANNKKAIFDWMINDMAKRQSDKMPKQTKRLNKSKTNSNIR